MQYVSGYYRGQDQTKSKDNGGTIIAATILGSTLLIFAVLFWYITLGAMATGASGYLLHKHYTKRQWLRANGLQVNYLNGKREFV